MKSTYIHINAVENILIQTVENIRDDHLLAKL